MHLTKSKDIFTLVGTLKPKIPIELRGKTIDEIIKIEEESVADAVVERYVRKEKRSTGKLLTI